MSLASSLAAPAAPTASSARVSTRARGASIASRSRPRGASVRVAAGKFQKIGDAAKPSGEDADADAAASAPASGVQILGLANEDGTLKKVALKCMKNKAQFLTEVQVRDGLDEEKVVGALRVHVPPSFEVQKAPAITDRPNKVAAAITVEDPIEQPSRNIRPLACGYVERIHLTPDVIIGIASSKLWRVSKLRTDHNAKGPSFCASL